MHCTALHCTALHCTTCCCTSPWLPHGAHEILSFLQRPIYHQSDVDTHARNRVWQSSGRDAIARSQSHTQLSSAQRGECQPSATVMIGAEQTARARAIAEFSRFGDRFVRTAHSSTCGCGFAIARLHRVVRPESERKANGLTLRRRKNGGATRSHTKRAGGPGDLTCQGLQELGPLIAVEQLVAGAAQTCTQAFGRSR